MYYFESVILNAFIAIVLIIALSYDYITKYFNYFYVRDIPYETPVPVVGSDTRRIFCMESTTDVINRLYGKFKNSKYVGYFKARIPDIIVRDPETIGLILEKDFIQFKNRGLCLHDSTDVFVRNNLYFCENEKWKILREKLEQIFTDDFSAKIYENISKSASNIKEKIPKHSAEINITDLALKLSCDCLVGGETNIYEIAKDLFNNKNKLKSYIMNIFPSIYKLLRFKTISKDNSFEITKLMDQELKSVENCVDLIKQLKEVDTCDVKERRFNNSKDIKIDDDVSKAQVYHIIREGVIPNAIAISIIIFEVANNDDLQRDLYEEIIKLDDLCFENMKSFKILEASVNECFRMYPFHSVIQRMCVETYKIPETNIVVDRGVTVQIPVLALHNDEKYYEKPGTFSPRRFLEDTFDRRRNYTYLPFGIGPRKCIDVSYIRESWDEDSPQPASSDVSYIRESWDEDSPQPGPSGIQSSAPQSSAPSDSYYSSDED